MNGGFFGDRLINDTESLMPANATVVTATFESADLDTDSDGIPDYFEGLIGTDKNSADTDVDGLPDGYELDRTLNIFNLASPLIDNF